MLRPRRAFHAFVLWLGILAGWFSLSPSSFAAHRLIVQVTAQDAVQGHPLPSAWITVIARQEIKGADGMIRLTSLAHSSELASAACDSQGRCQLVLESSSAFHWLALECQADGYYNQIISLVKAVDGVTNHYSFKLIPEQATPVEARLWEEKRAMEKMELWMHHPEVDQRETPMRQEERRGTFHPEDSPGENRVVNYPVPEQVYVSNLAETGFTGLLDLEELVAGTVTAEMNDGFPLEALKAQAVASRTYSLDRLRRRGQANGGQAYTARIGAKSLTATRNTASVVLLYQGTPITAYFSARCNGDYTLNSEEGATLSNCQVGALGAGVVPWARSRPCSGHANCASTSEPCCQVVVRGKVNHLYGHGVGLCQRGAQDLAGQDGWNWESILTNYYTGIVIANGYGLTVGSSFLTSTRVNLRTAACGSTVISTIPADTSGIITAGPQRPDCSLAGSYSYLTWWEVSLANGQRGWMAEDYLRLLAEAPLMLRLDWQRTDGGLLLSWPSNRLDVVLQQTPRLGPGAPWVTPSFPAVLSNGIFRVQLDTAQANQFYRLMVR